ncbi:hypothetical protein BV22DRAFT_1051534 [Leucogyrophana mollusca]|uniref:Uncharacterized protein n=1 Tax=Leucogyrophana mollusca TaxID=85980 RepID=A0ACB8B0V8_9AGAM|nr:hypothetical protein BV22DRAFT_1051534 [Leucogyrophana mollusca]
MSASAFASPDVPSPQVLDLPDLGAIRSTIIMAAIDLSQIHEVHPQCLDIKGVLFEGQVAGGHFGDIWQGKWVVVPSLLKSPETSLPMIQNGPKAILGHVSFSPWMVNGNILHRTYLNRQTAVAHSLIFEKIQQIVYDDTSKTLQWRHLHAESPDGQAKGLGLHLKRLAQGLDKYDLHEPHRHLSSLNEYDHLHRIFRLCSVHVYWNIKATCVPDSVKKKMQSLVCMRHQDWDRTVCEIEIEGGKAGRDKIRPKFAFEGMCWSRSFMPRVVWQIGDANSNIIEGLHADVNREGISCTLLGGIKKGQYFDSLKLKSLRTYEETHPSDRALRNLKRKVADRHRTLVAQDSKISTQNKKLKTAHSALSNASQRLTALQEAATSSITDITKVVTQRDRASAMYSKALEGSMGVVGTGTGKVGVLLPPTARDAIQKGGEH